MNILLINNIFKQDNRSMVGGVEYHRMVKPHTVLQRKYPEHDVVMSNALEAVPEEYLKQTDLIIFCRLIPETSRKRLEELSIPFGLDIDDYWRLPRYHVLSNHYAENNIPKLTEESISMSDFVICTTPILAEKIKPLNQNVCVIENGIDAEDPVWQPRKVASDRVRFGFTQGNTHFEDLKTISEKVVKSYSDNKFYHKAQVVLTGFHGEILTEKTIEQYYELLLTNNYKTLSLLPGYVKDLKHLNKTDFDAPYKRIWAKPVDEFASIYDEIDVSVAPLISNEFNSCKSELKMIEAAYKDCAIMVNHVKPYTLLATDKNSFDMNKKNFFEWQRYLLLNPNAIEDSKAQLKEDTKKYNLDLLSDKRHQLYKQYERPNTTNKTRYN